MLIILIIIQIVPPMISVILYERFRGYTLSDRKRLALFMIFTFFINMIGYSAAWLRGLGSLDWSLGVNSTMKSTSFMLKFMALSLVSAIMLPYAVCILRLKTKPGTEKTDNSEDAAEQDSEDFIANSEDDSDQRNNE